MKSNRNTLYIQKDIKESENNMVDYMFIVDGKVFSEGKMRVKTLYKAWSEYNPIIAFVNELPNRNKYGR